MALLGVKVGRGLKMSGTSEWHANNAKPHNIVLDNGQ